MISKIRAFKRIFIAKVRRFGANLQMNPTFTMSFHRNHPPHRWQNAMVDVGCGDSPRDGFVGCDIRALPTVKIVCRAWDLSHHSQQLDAIYCRHMLEHLTLAESILTLKDWYCALGDGGTLEIIVPNIEFHIDQWRSADWKQTFSTDTKCDAVWGFAGFYGWQRECDPTKPNYNQTYWDVHKSAYNEARIAFLLSDVGFDNISTAIVDRCHLVAKARKPN